MHNYILSPGTLNNLSYLLIKYVLIHSGFCIMQNTMVVGGGELWPPRLGKCEKWRFGGKNEERIRKRDKIV